MPTNINKQVEFAPKQVQRSPLAFFKPPGVCQKKTSVFNSKHYSLVEKRLVFYLQKSSVCNDTNSLSYSDFSIM